MSEKQSHQKRGSTLLAFVIMDWLFRRLLAAAIDRALWASDIHSLQRPKLRLVIP